MLLRELLAQFDVKVDTKDIDTASKRLDVLLGAVQRIAAGALSVQVGKFFFQWVDGARQTADHLNDMTQRLGVSAQALQTWGYSMKLAGLEAGSAEMAFNMLHKAQGDAATGSKTQAAMFAQLKIPLSDLKKLKPDELMWRVVDGMSALKTDTDRTNIAFGLFGRAGKEILPLLNQGSNALRAQAAEFKDLGAAMSDDFIETAATASDNIDKLEFSFQGLRNMIAVQAVPWINWLVLKATNLIKSFEKLSANTSIVKAALLALGTGVGVLVFQMRGLLIYMGLAAAKIAILVLLVDDLIALFSGGKSVIGDFIDTLFGVGAAAEVVHYLTDAWEGAVLAIRDAIDAVREFIGWESEAGHNRRQQVRKDRYEALVPGLADQNRRNERIAANPAPLDERRGVRSGIQAPLLQGVTMDDIRTRVGASNRTSRVGTATPTAPRSAGAGDTIIIAPSTNVTVNAGNANAAETAAKVRTIIREEAAKTLANTYSALVPSK